MNPRKWNFWTLCHNKFIIKLRTHKKQREVRSLACHSIDSSQSRKQLRIFRRRSRKEEVSCYLQEAHFFKKHTPCSERKLGTYLPDQIRTKIKTWSFLQEDKAQMTWYTWLPFVVIQATSSSPGSTGRPCGWYFQKSCHAPGLFPTLIPLGQYCPKKSGHT